MKTIGRYEVVGELGRGGWGVVYRAIDPGLGRTVAIKTIHANNDAKDIRERFHREARTAGMLSHPNIVTVYEFSDTGDVMFIAMEYVDGQTLAQKMRDGALPMDFTLAITRAASEALDFAHAHNIVHRDVKPGNFIISKDGHLKMADFGIAKILDSEVGLTSTGMVIGTAQYMSPEQIAAKEVTGRSDQFSLAVIAYEMLTGHRPFQGNSWASMMHAIISSEPPALSEYRKELGDEATQVLRKGLAKDPLQRYPTCRSMVDALDHALLGPTAERPSYLTVTAKLPIDALTDYRAEVTARPKISSGTEGPLSDKTETMLAPPPPAATAPVTPVLPPPNGSSITARSRRPWAVLAGVAAVAVLGIGSWFVFRTNDQYTAQKPASSAPGKIDPIPQVSGPNSSEPSAGPATAATTASPSPSANLPNPPPVAAPAASAPSATSAPSVSLNPPAAVPSPAPKRAIEDQARRAAEEQAKRAVEEQAKRTADEQARRAAEEQAKRTADEQAKRLAEQQAKSAAEEQAKRTADEQAKRLAEQQAKTAAEAQAKRTADEQARRMAEQQAKSAAEAQAKRTADEQAKRMAEEQAKTAAEEKVRIAHAAELQSVARTLANYKNAYESKDVAALQEIWPSISKTALDDIRGSFRDASDVKIDIHAVGDPEIAGDTATVVCDRNLRQIIRKKTFQASSRVRIALNRKGTGWVIASIDTVK